jgi:hypothetical protein
MTAGVKRRVTCREPFKKSNTFPLARELLQSLLSFTVDNMEMCQTNSNINSINTRYKHDLCQILTSLLARKVFTMQSKLCMTVPASMKVYKS